MIIITILCSFNTYVYRSELFVLEFLLHVLPQIGSTRGGVVFVVTEDKAAGFCLPLRRRPHLGPEWRYRRSRVAKFIVNSSISAGSPTSQVLLLFSLAFHSLESRPLWVTVVQGTRRPGHACTESLTVAVWDLHGVLGCAHVSNVRVPSLRETSFATQGMAMICATS